MSEPQTLSQKILARASGRADVATGEVLLVRVDRAMSYDPFAFELHRRLLARWGEAFAPWDVDRVVLVADHFLDPDIPGHGDLQRGLDRFAKAMGVRHYYPVGAANHGICHAVLPEEGLVRPGELIAGTDSHSCTYGGFGAIGLGVGLDAMEGIFAIGQYWVEVPPMVRIEVDGTFPPAVAAKDVILRIAGDLAHRKGLLGTAVELDGSAIQALHPEEKLTLANMAAELGARWLVVPPNDAVVAWVRACGADDFEPLQPDPDAAYAAVHRYAAADFAPVVARPGAPDDVVPVAALPRTRFNEVFVGSCTGAKRFDMEQMLEGFTAAGGRVADGVVLQIVPSTRKVRDWMAGDPRFAELLAQDRVQLAAQPGCNACCGAHGFLAGEKSVRFSTSNRNFAGRMGAAAAQVWLGAPRLAGQVAATGVLGG